MGPERSLSSSQRGVTTSTPKVRPVATSDLSASARQFQSLGNDSLTQPTGNLTFFFGDYIFHRKNMEKSRIKFKLLLHGSFG